MDELLLPLIKEGRGGTDRCIEDAKEALVKILEVIRQYFIEFVGMPEVRGWIFFDKDKGEEDCYDFLDQLYKGGERKVTLLHHSKHEDHYLALKIKDGYVEYFDPAVGENNEAGVAYDAEDVKLWAQKWAIEKFGQEERKEKLKEFATALFNTREVWANTSRDFREEWGAEKTALDNIFKEILPINACQLDAQDKFCQNLVTYVATR